MAPGFNVFSRVAHYIAQEVIVKGLANNRAFQQFALRSAEQISEVRNAVKDTAKKLSDTPTANQLKNVSIPDPQAQVLPSSMMKYLVGWF